MTRLGLLTVRSYAEERPFLGARLDVLNLRQRSYLTFLSRTLSIAMCMHCIYCSGRDRGRGRYA